MGDVVAAIVFGNYHVDVFWPHLPWCLAVGKCESPCRFDRPDRVKAVLKSDGQPIGVAARLRRATTVCQPVERGPLPKWRVGMRGGPAPGAKEPLNARSAVFGHKARGQFEVIATT